MRREFSIKTTVFAVLLYALLFPLLLILWWKTTTYSWDAVWYQVNQLPTWFKFVPSIVGVCIALYLTFERD